MKILLIFLLCTIFSSDLLQAQRIQQPVNPVISRNTPHSSRVSYSTSGRDSLRVDLINVNVPGLEIVSCTNCIADAPWIKLNGGQVEVVVKNRGTTKSNTATVWVEYATYQMITKGWYVQIAASARKGVPALNPAQTIKLGFDIGWGPGELYKKSKVVIVSLTQNGGSAWRERSE